MKIGVESFAKSAHVPTRGAHVGKSGKPTHTHIYMFEGFPILRPNQTAICGVSFLSFGSARQWVNSRV